MSFLFLALPVPPEVQKAAEAIQKGLANTNWQPMGKMHITVRLIGAVEQKIVEQVCTRLEMLDFGAFDLKLSGVGAFGTGCDPADGWNGVWAGIDRQETLSALKDEIDRLLRGLPLPKVGYDEYVPHMTLGQVVSPEPEGVADYIKRNRSFKSDDFALNSIVMYDNCSKNRLYGVVKSIPLPDARG